MPRTAPEAASGPSQPPTCSLAELRLAGWRSRPVKAELRENLTAAIARGDELFPGIVGYDHTVIPELIHAILAGHDMLFLGEKGQGKSRLMRALPRFLDEWIPFLVVPGCPVHEDPYAPITAVGKRHLAETPPELVRIEPEKVTADRVRQVIYYPAMEEKIPLLLGLLRKTDAHRTMVFVNTKRMAERLEDVLRANGINAQALSGDVPQNKRLRFLREFHEGKLAVLIATDVASRGLHIADVSHVFNYDLPQDAEDYVHRIGRTARAGAEGDAISFACDEYAISLPDIESYIGHQVPRGAISGDDLASVIPPPPAQWRERAFAVDRCRHCCRARGDLVDDRDAFATNTAAGGCTAH